jgi:hypothetical protein
VEADFCVSFSSFTWQSAEIKGRGGTMAIFGVVANAMDTLANILWRPFESMKASSSFRP